MSSEFGKKIHVSIFGQSHGKSIGVTIDGLPAGEAVDENELISFMQRRRPGKDKLSTSRNEPDMPIFLSGIENGATCGFPISAIIENTNTRSSDYASLKNLPRPGHADYTAFVKWHGEADMRGGGHFSGRLTAPLCIAGGICKQILARRGIYIGAHLVSVGKERDSLFPLFPDKTLFDTIAAKTFPVIDDTAGERMKAEIALAASEADSVGGIIECAVTGIPAGIGSPMFEGVENHIASAIFGVPAVKGIEFGSGFDGSALRGSENNDPFRISENGIVSLTQNNSGGILGGITSGMPIVFKTAIKPTPSIGKPQKTVNLSDMTEETLEIKGRHDPCIAHRAVPVIEAVTSIVVLDMLMEDNTYGTL